MKRKAHAFLMMCALFAMAGAFAAETDTVSCPALQVGDRYEVLRGRDKDTYTISAVSGDLIEVTLQNGVTISFDKSFNTIKALDGRTFSPKLYTGPDCPFKLGERKSYPPASWPGSRSGTNIGRSAVVTVDGQWGTTKVAAGEFKTVRIVSVLDYDLERSGRIVGSARITSTAYVTPDGIILRRVSEDQDFSARTTNTYPFEITSLPRANVKDQPLKQP